MNGCFKFVHAPTDANRLAGLRQPCFKTPMSVPVSSSAEILRDAVRDTIRPYETTLSATCRPPDFPIKSVADVFGKIRRSVPGQLRKSATSILMSVKPPGPDLNHGKADLDQGMSVKRPKAEVARRRWHFRYVPIPEVRPLLCVHKSLSLNR